MSYPTPKLIIVRYLHAKCLKLKPECGYVNIEFWTKKVELNNSTLETRYGAYIVYFKAT